MSESLDFFVRAVLFVVTLCCGCFALVYTVVYFSGPQVSTSDRREAKFRTACESVGGKTVWNGRQWECLK